MLNLIDVKHFDLEWFKEIPIQKRRRGNQGNKHRAAYKDIITAFDIETCTLPDIEQSFMYIWQWQFGDKCTVIGRTWDDFLQLVEKISSVLNGSTLVVYVHNLSFEFQFLKGIWDFGPEDVFAMDTRKVLKACMGTEIEFRCSYLHSNMSLAEFTKKMGAEHTKLSGTDFDYSKTRYPWTPLSDRELEYCINDVLGLVEALTIEMRHDGDNLYTVPLTSTGYVRRDAKKAMRHVPKGYIKRQLPDYHDYKLLREAFRGGNTHASRFKAGWTVENVKSADRSSSYPDVLCNCDFPIGTFYQSGRCALPEIIDLITVRHKAVAMRVRMQHVTLSDPFWPCPYLSRDKCRNIKNGIFDNGRILSADYLETTITDVDLMILLEEYTFDNFDAYDVIYTRYGRLPPEFVQTICQYYTDKTELKNVPGEELHYMKSKNKLNSLYGMCAQDPVKTNLEFKDGLIVEKNENPEDLLENHNRYSFLSYQWGVWCTAWARLRLEEGIRLAGHNFVYADTDSVKYIGEIDWTKYNKRRIKDSKASGAFATDPSGETHYMGVYEFDGKYAEFRTLGAKKYCYKETSDGPLHVTIAGVDKHEGGPELEEFRGIESFEPGFIFRKAGGTESVYNDFPTVGTLIIDGHELPITSNVVIKNSTYTLGITHEYMQLLYTSGLLLPEYREDLYRA